MGELTSLGGGEYGFAYTDGAGNADLVPLAEFPDLGASYVTRSLPAFFANRVMSSRRSSYRTYLSWLGLGDAPTPMEILARTGGGRATDTFHVVDPFDPGEGGLRSGRFFACGLGHVDQIDAALSDVRPGHKLRLVDEPETPGTPLAIQLGAGRARDERTVGWVPDWLVGDAQEMRETYVDPTITVDRVNRDAPNHLKLLCLLVATV